MCFLAKHCVWLRPGPSKFSLGTIKSAENCSGSDLHIRPADSPTRAERAPPSTTTSAQLLFHWPSRFLICYREQDTITRSSLLQSSVQRLLWWPAYTAESSKSTSTSLCCWATHGRWRKGQTAFLFQIYETIIAPLSDALGQ